MIHNHPSFFYLFVSTFRVALDKKAEMDFVLNGKHYTARMEPSQEFKDISGLYYEWDAEGVDKINGADAQTRIAFADNISNVLWNDAEMMYSVYTPYGAL